MASTTIHWPIRTVITWRLGENIDDKVAVLSCDHEIVNPDARRKATTSASDPKRRRCQQCHEYQEQAGEAPEVFDSLARDNQRQAVEGHHITAGSGLTEFTLTCGHTTVFPSSHPYIAVKLGHKFPCPTCFDTAIQRKLTLRRMARAMRDNLS